jgi:predicted DNA-binding transcriptional regulator AlpA
MSSDLLPELLTAAMIRKHLLPISKRTLQRYLAAGEFPSADVRVNNLAFWRKSNVLAWIEQHATTEATR